MWLPEHSEQVRHALHLRARPGRFATAAQIRFAHAAPARVTPVPTTIEMARKTISPEIRQIVVGLRRSLQEKGRFLYRATMRSGLAQPRRPLPSLRVLRA